MGDDANVKAGEIDSQLFDNNSTPRYSEEAAKLAWERTIDFFDEHLY